MAEIAIFTPSANGADRETCVFGPFELWPNERRLQRGATVVPLGSRAMDLLITLVERAGEGVSKRELSARAWRDLTVNEGSLRFHIASLRKALGDDKGAARYVANVIGRGYSFVAPVERRTHVAPRRAREGHAIAPLPPALTRMIGRSEAVQAICGLLGERRFVSIVGPGGMGKTTVAVSVARTLAEDFGGAAFFVDLAAQSDPGLVVGSVAGALGVATPTGDSIRALVNFVGERRILLVVDNCEHVIEAAALMLERLFSEIPHLHLLVASREALRVEGEAVYLLEPLVSPRETRDLTAESAMSTSAVQLFMDRAVASGHLMPLADEEAHLVADICRKLDGIALAIELAGSRVGAYGIAGIADLLRHYRFGLLWRGRRSAAPRHQTLDAMLDWSCDLLMERDRKVFCRLSVFVGAFALETAQSVAADQDISAMDVAESIAGLVDRSLVTPSRGYGRDFYRLLEMRGPTPPQN